MASTKVLNPAMFSNIEEIDSWLSDLQVWQCLTDLEKKKQYPVICFTLPDKAGSSRSDTFKRAWRDILVTNFNKGNGLDTLIQWLETLYFKDAKLPTYLASGKFESSKRTSDMGIIDYLNKFERLCYEV